MKKDDSQPKGATSLIKPYELKKIALGATFTAASLIAFDSQRHDLMSAAMLGMDNNNEKVDIAAFPIINPTIKYGFAIDTFISTEGRIKSDMIFETLLAEHGIPRKVADSLSKQIRSAYDFSKIQDGKPYLFLTKNTATGADYFIFEPDAKRYIIFNFKGTPSVKEVKREVVVVNREIGGTVKESLWETMVKSGFGATLANMVEDALKYQIDLRSFKDGDEFKLIYEEEIVEGRSVGIKELKAVHFLKKGEDSTNIYAVHYANKDQKGYYSKDGLPMKSGFLKAPVKYAHITSGFNLNRLHPVLGYHKAHYGTDYAAPTGTPILSVADGTIAEIGYGGGNGNYVKVRHMKPYETQYLHMSRFVKGMRKGDKVKQGQVIGYVGSTGLATGPHVCFRFWKNGNQVNHLREKLPMVSTFTESDKKQFKVVSDSLMEKMKGVRVLTFEELITRKAEIDKKAKA